MQEYHEIKEVNGQYIVHDETTGGYVDRMTGNLVQRWESVWNKELQLVSLKLCFEELVEVLADKDKEHYDYHRAVRTKNRHLRLLKEHLGVPAKKVKRPVKKEEKLIWLQKGYYSQLDELTFHKAVVHDKTLDDGLSRFKKHEIYHSPVTPEKLELMNDYNNKLQEFKSYQKETFDKIFNKKE